jgi:hypothetical protein
MKISNMCAVAALAIAGAATAVSAQTVSFASSGDNPANFNGGEFTATFTNGAAPLRAFCLERSVVFTPGTQYGYSFSDRAFSGGPGGANDPNNVPDPISAATAWIFTQFLGGADFGVANANARNVIVQLAIWKLEDEGGSFGFTPLGIVEDDIDDLIALVPTEYGQGELDATQFPSVFGNIRALNPTNVDGTGDYQSMIVLIPLPTASGMALAGLALVGGIRRRK